MKVYLITEAEMKSLNDQLELSHMKANNILGQHDPQRFENSELYRAFNFVVRRWQNGVEK